ncbi:hypothetical protein BCR35DRAFT_53956 [Leucosporidium creatinivorum]|uniref:Uncharacterized protein n=1 Tax=Leucosporidium creatinivorum TaxID=106004 RepID=A0A1Y2FP39_9BASI|nr:hypothetical protein BCR35DRAFT_53956 [Leucosporidium creatinivorum]
MTDITCTINYACDASEAGATPFNFAKLLETGTPLSIRPIPTLIRDVRPSFEKGEGPTVGVQGFEAVKQKYEGVLDGEKGWEETYAQDMAGWLQAHLGAKRVAQYGASVRRRILDDDPEHPKEFDTSKLQPATVAHCDGSQYSANKRARETLGLTNEEAASSRIAIINVWRPLVGPVVDSPLALCDTRTVQDRDYIITEDYYGQGSFFRHCANRHKFYYLRDMMPDELLLLRCFDSSLGRSRIGLRRRLY